MIGYARAGRSLKNHETFLQFVNADLRQDLVRRGTKVERKNEVVMRSIISFLVFHFPRFSAR